MRRFSLSFLLLVLAIGTSACGSRFSLTNQVARGVEAETDLRLLCDDLDASTTDPTQGTAATRRLAALAEADGSAAWTALRTVLPLPPACDFLGDASRTPPPAVLRDLVTGLTVPGTESVADAVRTCHAELASWGADWSAGLPAAGAERARYARALGRILERAGLPSPAELVLQPGSVAAAVDFSSPFVFVILRVAASTDAYVLAVADSVPFASAVTRAAMQRVAAELFAIASEFALRRLEARRGLRVSPIGAARSACRFLRTDAQMSTVARAAMQRLVLRVALTDPDRVADYRHIAEACGQGAPGEGGWNRACRRVLSATGLQDTLAVGSSDVAGAWVPALDGPLERAMASEAEREATPEPPTGLVTPDSLAVALDACADIEGGCDPTDLSWLGGLAARDQLDVEDDATRGQLRGALRDLAAQAPELANALYGLEERLGRIELATHRVQAAVGDPRDGQATVLDRLARVERSLSAMELAIGSLASCRSEQDRVVRVRLQFLEELGFAVGTDPGSATFDGVCLGTPDRASTTDCPSSAYCLDEAGLHVELSRDFVCAITTIRFEPRVSFSQRYEDCSWTIPDEDTRRAITGFGARITSRLGARPLDLFSFRGVSDRAQPRSSCRQSIRDGGPRIEAFQSLSPNRQLALLRAWEIASLLQGGALDASQLARAVEDGGVDGMEDMSCDPRAGESWCRRVEISPRADRAADLFRQRPELAGGRCR